MAFVHHKSKVLVAQLCLTLRNPINYSPPGPSIYGILQTRILEWVAMTSCRGIFPTQGSTQLPCIADRFFAVWAMRKAHRKIHRTYQNYLGYFPGSLVAKTSHPSCRWPRVHMLLLRVCMSQCREISSATTKTQHSQIKNIYILKNKTKPWWSSS